MQKYAMDTGSRQRSTLCAPKRAGGLGAWLTHVCVLVAVAVPKADTTCPSTLTKIDFRFFFLFPAQLEGM